MKRPSLKRPVDSWLVFRIRPRQLIRRRTVPRALGLFAGRHARQVCLARRRLPV
jgi:hypothetical protein